MNRSRQVQRNRRRTRRHMSGGTLVGWLWLAMAVLPSAGWSATANREVEEKREMQGEVPLPAFPQPDKLIPFVVSAMTDNKFMIDSESLSIGSDGIFRYTLVIVSPSGAQNVSYEAMDCSTAERRIYALGRADKTWSKARSDQWVKIVDNSLNRHHAELYTDYFCPIGISIRNADEVREALRRGGHPSMMRR
ncbi:MAG: CNP1-like family protein [Candidatus Accumulibacter vicinus]|uniref:CNP1-like family protein n=2 Tax=Candidatus Accumulibacter vicinus TaxID=2954382 RepID=A0A084Y0V0_9PROT|nr:MAG: CNP1-like family protein [Candidatus Accumulibacter vicinus]